MFAAEASFEIVASPTEHWLSEQLVNCKTRFLVACPYVGNALARLVKGVAGNVERVLITRTDLRGFAMGSSNLQTIRSLARDGMRVLSLARLHAKVYVLDDSRALITSANATVGGMRKNLECGIAISQPGAVDEVARMLLGGFGAAEEPQPVGVDELDSLTMLLAKVKPLFPQVPRIETLVPAEPALVRLQVKDNSDLLEPFTGWIRLTLEGVLAQESTVFSLDDLQTACEGEARRKYPDNQHVRAKLRQQLQRLRDFGLLEFLGQGKYATTFTLGGG